MSSDFQALLIKYMEEYHDVDIEDIDVDTPLFSSNIMDSFAMVDLVTFVEKEANVKFEALDLHLNNLDSIEKILAYVARKQN